jgi:7-cyano-7-deazaguanine synthase
MSTTDTTGPRPGRSPDWPESLTTIAVLISGGLDSAILLANALRIHEAVQPLYVRQGLYWEPFEWAHLDWFLHAVRTPALRALHILEMPSLDLYCEHWSVTGHHVPDASTPDEAVYLPGRNVLLLAKSMLWCHLNGCPAVALATLGSNPFPDATPAFFDGFEAAVNRAIGGAVRILRPYGALHKTDVMRLGRDLPLELTFSCIQPVAGEHCGVCNKCEERKGAFAEAGMSDPTHYAKGPA